MGPESAGGSEGLVDLLDPVDLLLYEVEVLEAP